MSGNKLFILLPVFNRLKKTQEFIAGLKRQMFQDFHLVLLDDGSTDGTADWVKQALPGVTVIQGNGTWWWGGALHVGRQWLIKQNFDSEKFVMIINDDTIIAPDFLENGIKALESRPRSILFARNYSAKSGALLDAGVFADWKNLFFTCEIKPEQINCLSSRGLLLRISDLIAIGGFYPTLLPHYGSDYEYTYRAGKMGYQLWTVPEFRLSFDESSTGLQVIEARGLMDFWKKSFSKRSPKNPLMWSAFILISCPWLWKLHNLMRVWVRLVRESVQQISITGFVYSGLLQARKDESWMRLRFFGILRRLMIPVFGKAIVSADIKGLQMQIPFSHNLPFIFITCPKYADNLALIAARVRLKYPSMTFIDIGANVGDTVALLREKASFPILCIEGDPYYFNLLKTNMKALSNVALEEVLIAESDSHISARLETQKGTAHLVKSQGSPVIRTARLGSVLKSKSEFAGAKMLKIDTDGFDGIIIRACADYLSTAKPVLFFEYDPYFLEMQKDDGVSIFKFLSDLGYETALVYDNQGLLDGTLTLKDSAAVQAMHGKVSGFKGEFYYDVCAFHREDRDLFDDLSKLR